MTQYYTEIVKLYATALFDYADEKNILDKLSQEVNAFEVLLEEDANIIKNIAAPVYSEKEQRLLINNIAKVLALSKEMVNFLLLLGKNTRLSLLVEIFKFFQELIIKRSGSKIVEVTLFEALNAVQQKEIKANLEKKFSSKIELSFKIDPKILGGIIIKIDGKMIDASLVSKFIHLSNIVEKRIALL